MFGEEYASVYPKVKAWMVTLLRRESLEDVLRLSYADFVAFLKKNTRKVEIQSDNPIHVEGLLKQEGFYFLQSGRRFLSGSTKEFIEAWSSIYEIENLKMATRSILNEKPIEYLYKLGDTSRIQIEFMKNIRTFDELQEFLSGTEYYRIALDGFSRIQQDQTTFYFELSLDNYYALGLKRKMTSLSIADRRDVKNIFLYYLELQRAVWIYRARFNFGMSPESTVSILPNVFRFLSRSQYKRLLDTDQEENYFSVLRDFGYIGPAESVGESLETAINRSIYKRTRKVIGGSPFNLGVFLGFMILNGINVRNMIALLEGKRYQFPSDQIASMLIA